MERKEKYTTKINIVDAIAVVLIILVGLFAVYRLLFAGDKKDGPMTKVTYTIRAEGVPAEIYDNALEHLPSPLMASGKLVGGQIESVRKQPYYVLSPNGEWVEDPEHVTLYFTATTETPTGEVMLTKVGEQEVRIGKTDYILKSEYIELKDITVVDVTWENLDS